MAEVSKRITTKCLRLINFISWLKQIYLRTWSYPWSACSVDPFVLPSLPAAGGRSMLMPRSGAVTKSKKSVFDRSSGRNVSVMSMLVDDILLLLLRRPRVRCVDWTRLLVVVVGQTWTKSEDNTNKQKSVNKKCGIWFNDKRNIKLIKKKKNMCVWMLVSLWSMRH